MGPPFESYDDYGLTIDAAWALDAVGGHVLELAAMTTALEASIPSYVFSAGSAAKMDAFLLSQGIDNTDTDDLTDEVESHIETVAPNDGRLVDPDPNDFNSPLTQAFAVSALNNADSSLAGSARGFLLDQQCSPGFFRSSFSAKNASDQTCDGATSPTASVDTTAISVLMLQDQKSKPAVRTAIKKARAWLATNQAADGSFAGGNANATGLAGWVLGLADSADTVSGLAAEKAAYWLRTHQLANAGTCTPFAAADDGAVVLDDLGYTNAKSGPLDALDTSVAVRATTQAAPALEFAAGQGPAVGVRSGETTVTGPEGFVPAGSTQQLSILGAPGNTVCVSKGTSPYAPDTRSTVVLDANGTATVPVVVPPGTGRFDVATEDAGTEQDLVHFAFLGKTTFDVKVKPVVQKGAQVVVSLSGLAAGEDVTVTLGAKTAVATAKANGKVKVKLVATKPGKQKVKAVGEFTNRKGKASLTVTS